MKYKTSELTGALLDAAVAIAEGYAVTYHPPDTRRFCMIQKPGYRSSPQEFSPSTKWAQGGPIIERNDWALPMVNRYQHTKHLGGYVSETPGAFSYYGATPLIAAMRAFVAANLGEEVELPG